MQEEIPVVDMCSWAVDCRREPTIRIGIVLPEDGATELCVEVPPAGWRAAAGLAGDRTWRSVSGRVVARAKGEGVELDAPVGEVGVAEAWCIAPPNVRPLDDASTVKVRNVVAGRGFHWQKQIDVLLPGQLEIRRVDGRLVLVNVVLLDTYLKGVITGEMSGDCPLDLLKAQCVTARAWTLARTECKHSALSVDFCNDDCCQRYQGFTHMTSSAREAVDQTRGEVMLDSEGGLIDANYSKSCGGISEAGEWVWGFPKQGQRAIVDAPDGSSVRRFLPVTADNLDDYLAGEWLAQCDAFCSPRVAPEADLPRYLGAVDEEGAYFRWSVQRSREELEAILRAKHFDRVGIGGRESLAILEDLVVTRRGHSGRAIDLDIVYRDRDDRVQRVSIEDQYWIRHALAESFLYSSAIKIDVDRDDGGLAQVFRLTGAGWGHGAGLCQIGALGMALAGYDYRTILHHYFSNVRIERVYG